MKTNFHDKNFVLSLAFIMRFNVTRKWPIDLSHSAAMLSLWRIKALFLHGKPRPDANLVRGLLSKTKLFILLRLNMAAE